MDTPPPHPPYTWDDAQTLFTQWKKSHDETTLNELSSVLLAEAQKRSASFSRLFHSRMNDRDDLAQESIKSFIVYLRKNAIRFDEKFDLSLFLNTLLRTTAIQFKRAEYCGRRNIHKSVSLDGTNKNGVPFSDQARTADLEAIDLMQRLEIERNGYYWGSDDMTLIRLALKDTPELLPAAFAYASPASSQELAEGNGLTRPQVQKRTSRMVHVLTQKLGDLAVEYREAGYPDDADAAEYTLGKLAKMGEARSFLARLPASPANSAVPSFSL